MREVRDTPRGEEKKGAYVLIEIKTTTNVLDRVLDSLPGWTDRRDLLGCEGLERFGDQVRLSSDHRFPTLSVHDVRRVSIKRKCMPSSVFVKTQGHNSRKLIQEKSEREREREREKRGERGGQKA